MSRPRWPTDKTETAAKWPAEPTSADRRADVRWTTGSKDGVGASADTRSRVWFTLVRGTLSELFYPSVDRPNLRRAFIVVATRDGVFVDGTSYDYQVRPIASWAPAYRVTTPLPFGGLTLRKLVITDVQRSVVLQRTRLRGPPASADGARMFVVAEPHLDNDGSTNDVWLGEYKGVRALLARGSSTALAVMCSRPLITGACRYVGQDDALADIVAHGRLTRAQASAMSGNVQVAAEVSLDDSRELVIAIGLGVTPDHAAQQARESLLGTFGSAARRYVSGWRQRRSQHDECPVEGSRAVHAVFDASVAMLHVHRDKERSGAIIASMAIPWGNAHDDHRKGGYHLVWPRDLVESAGALLAVGRAPHARRTLAYLMSTQESDGLWPQNMWLDGTPHFRGVQLDAVALPIVLARMLAHHDALGELDPWPMVRAAVGYLVRAGPVTPEDRWEEEAGYSPYTIAAEVAALVAAAAFAEESGDTALASYLRDTADDWVASLDRWTYVRETNLAERHGVDGYYVRMTPPAAMKNGGQPVLGTPLCLANQLRIDASVPYEDVVSPDALALVRFGLRSADDERIRNTVAVVDAELRTVTKRGPAWHRYTGDGYGEPPDGSPHLDWGIGRAWPLLTGERAHYELARGKLDRATRLLRAMAAQANASGMIPEQIWDTADIPDEGLFNGRPTGSAMPLVWAHAEFLKLCRSIHDGRVFDMPCETAARYATNTPTLSRTVWRGERPISVVRPGHVVRVEAPGARGVDWRVTSADHHRVDACQLSIGMSYADLPTAELAPGTAVRFRILDVRGDDATEHTVYISEEDE